MKKINLLAMGLVLMGILGGCANQKAAEEKVEKKITEVPAIKALNYSEEARDFINKSEKLSADQKKLLLGIQEKAHLRSEQLKEEIEKVKVVLSQTIIEPKMNYREFGILKKKLTTLEKQRVENSLKAITEVRNVIEPVIPFSDRGYYDHFYHPHFQEF